MYHQGGVMLDQIDKPPKGVKLRAVIKPCNPNAEVRDNWDGEIYHFTHIMIAKRGEEEVHFFAPSEEEAKGLTDFDDLEEWLCNVVDFADYLKKRWGYICLE